MDDDEAAFAKFLDSARYALLRLKARQFALEAFQAELAVATQEETFSIANDIVWRAAGSGKFAGSAPETLAGRSCAA